jgi:hypothetical protein
MKAVTCTNAKILIDPKSDAPTGAGKSASSTEALKRELHAQVLLPPLHRRSRVRVIESRPPRRRRPLLHGRRQIIGHDSGQSRWQVLLVPRACLADERTVFTLAYPGEHTECDAALSLAAPRCFRRY